ncbi:S-layer homology domain-containing protein [Lysinibacillus xylanilyticus]|uniref:S-layer homology domain-containing protein n=1 Tax=Lysinibacillus xylanilyticus TaxID=582475 RepID=UPI003D006A16
MREIKQKKWWKRSLATMLSLTLVASTLSMGIVPDKAQAASSVMPGGISEDQVTLWVKADTGVTADGDKKVTGWTDQAGKNTLTVSGIPKYEANGVNFNPVVNFNGSSYLTGDQSIDMLEAYTVTAWNGQPNTNRGTVLSPTTQASGKARYFFWSRGDSYPNMYTGIFDSVSSTDNPYLTAPSPADGEYNLWNAAAAPDNVYRKNGQNVLIGNNETGTTMTGIPRIGKRNASNTENLKGNIAELIVLNKAVAQSERDKVESYLALKYGITLNDKYVNTAGEAVWSVDSKYKNNIAGISRDDAEGLHQKQSRSINKGTQVAIGLTALQETNELNTAELIDKQYLIWGDNGQRLAFEKQISASKKNHTERVWKVQNTGNVSEVQIAIPKSEIPEDATLLVGNSDTDFKNATEHTLTEISLNNEKYYAAKVTLGHNQYFTFAAPAPEPVGVTLEEVGANGNQITLTFDQEIALTDLTGFTIKVDGTPVIPTFTVDPTDSKKLILTLPDGTDVTGKTVQVNYNGSGNLQGKNSVPVRSFTKDITNVDKLQLEAKVKEVNSLTESDYTSESWAVFQKALNDAKAVLNDQNATQAEVDAALEALNKAYEGLAKVPTAPEVDKTALQNKVTAINNENLKETEYTPASWKAMQEALAEAEAKLADGKATQEEVDAALEALNKAYEGLAKVPTTSEVDKTALQNKVAAINNENLKETEYTPASWNAMQEALAEAEATLTDGKATQEEVDAALEALNKAYEGLAKVPTTSEVDKTALQNKVTAINNENLKETEYTPASWKAMQEALAEAEATLTDGKATQEEVDAALEALNKAYEGLAKVPTTSEVDKTALQNKVAAINNENLKETEYTPASWKAMQEAFEVAQAVLNNPKATQAEVDAALAQLTAAQNALVKIPVQTPGLGSLKPSTGTLSPNFSSEVTNYTMNVDYATSQLSFTALPLNPGAKVTMTANGKAVNMGDFFPLSVGENTVMITVTDDTGSKTYVITVNRAKDTSSGSGSGSGSGGGGGSTWTPPTPPTETSTTTKIKVDLEVDGVNPMEKTPVEIERTKHANGQITDFVALTEANAKDAVQKAKQIGNNIARIVIPDVNDEVDKVTVEVPKQSIQTLRENGLSLEISTDNAHIAIPVSSMDGVNDNFYFRLVPVKKESERKAIEERARVEKVVRETLQSNDVRVVARPMTIETNMPSRPVQVTLPLKGVNVPTTAAEREAFLERLAVFIEHTDGEKKVVFPEVVTMAKGELGLRFTVDKFSTFTIIQFEKPTVGKHEAYIKGFPNGTFGPEKNVTRAQVATMIARILGYTDDQTVDYAPFNDTPSNHYAAGAIAFVKERGIMNGDMNGNFRASENITRAQMATVVANYKQLQIEEGVAITFNDTKGHWAQWIIEANRTAGIINGREDGSFAPNEHLTRAQAVVMMNRMFERGPLNGVTTPSFPDAKAKHWAFKEIEEAAKSHSYFIDEDKNEQLSK